MTAPGTLYDTGRLTGAQLRGVAPLAAYKAQVQAVTSSITPVNDDALLLQLAAGAVYYFKCKLGYTGGTSTLSDIRLNWALPSGASIGFTVYGNEPSGTAPAPWYTQSAGEVVLLTNGATTELACVMKGSIAMSSTPGAAQLQWAQHTSNATATSVLAGSSFLAWQVR